MTGLRQQIEDICIDAFEKAGFAREHGVVRESNRPDLADFQCNGLLSVAKLERMAPPQAAERVMPLLEQSDMFDVTFTPPGFLNFVVSDAALVRQVGEVLADPRGGIPLEGAPQHYLLDYGGPNLAKEMHVGHLRSSIVGHTLSTILRFAGNRVTSDVHLGDWGLQIGQLIAQIEDERPELLKEGSEGGFDMSDLQVWYPKASARSKEDFEFLERARSATAHLQAGRPEYERLWRAISDVSSLSLKRDFGRLGVEFDYWYGESRYQPMLNEIVDDLLEKGIAEVHQGAVIIRLPENEKLPPLILRNSNGGYGYGATDLATIHERVTQDQPDTILYVVDARQKTHFRQVFGAAARCGYLDHTTAEHIAFGTVNGADGKPFKTRAGGVMRLHDLLEAMNEAARKRLDATGAAPESTRNQTAEQIAIAAIRFGELCHDRESSYVFDIDKFVQFEGKTGPYIQYSCVRLRSLKAKAAESGLAPGGVTKLGEGGRDLVLCLDELPTQFERTIALRKPHVIANHAYKLANNTNRYYQANRILGGDATEEEARSHLGLLDAALQQLSLCLELLGIETPAQM